MEAGGDRREPVGVVESSGGRGLLCNLQQETLPSVQSRGASRDCRDPRQRTPPVCWCLSTYEKTEVEGQLRKTSGGYPAPLRRSSRGYNHCVIVSVGSTQS